MEEQLQFILDRIEGRHLSKLWLFYRNYFPNDEECLSFLYNALQFDPGGDPFSFHTDESDDKIVLSNDGKRIPVKHFIPRRMLNIVERLVNAAKDMDLIRRGQDVFKIIYIVSCVDSLQKMSGKIIDEKKPGDKKALFFDFFENYTPAAEKEYVSSNFWCDEYAESDCDPQKYIEENFKRFVGVIREARHSAAHEGDYWKNCFNLSCLDPDTPKAFTMEIDLNDYSKSEKKIKRHIFHTKLFYSDFERIFVRTCIEYISRYVEQLRQEELPVGS